MFTGLVEEMGQVKFVKVEEKLGTRFRNSATLGTGGCVDCSVVSPCDATAISCFCLLAWLRVAS